MSTQKSGIRTGEKIEAHNCPILCTCGYLKDEEKWRFCGYFCGTTDVTENMLLVSCKCNGKLVFSCEN